MTDPRAVSAAPRAESAAGTPDRLKKLQEDRGLETGFIQLWATSPERSWYLERRKKILRYVTVGVAIILLALGIWLAWRTSSGGKAALALSVAAFVVLGWCTVPYWAAKVAFRDRKRATAAYEVDVALRRVCEQHGKVSLPLPQLFELNRRQLNEYQEMTKRQQQMAFQLTWAASVLAFAVLVVGATVSLRVPAGSSQYVAGGLTGLGTLLSGFLGKTFFEGHRHAMDQLNYYYAEPSMTGRMLAAERIVEKLANGKQTDYARDIVKSLLTWQPPSAPLAKPGTSDAEEGQKRARPGRIRRPRNPVAQAFNGTP